MQTLEWSMILKVGATKREMPDQVVPNSAVFKSLPRVFYINR